MREDEEPDQLRKEHFDYALKKYEKTIYSDISSRFINIVGNWLLVLAI